MTYNYALWNDSYFQWHACLHTRFANKLKLCVFPIQYVCMFTCVFVRRGGFADCARSNRPLPVRAELSLLVSIRLMWHPDSPRQSATGTDETRICPQHTYDPVCSDVQNHSIAWHDNSETSTHLGTHKSHTGLHRKLMQATPTVIFYGVQWQWIESQHAWFF